MNTIAVDVLASDPVTEEGARARLSSYEEITVLPIDQRHRTEVLVVLVDEVTEDVLVRMERSYRGATCGELTTVLLASEIRQDQMLRAINAGLVSLLSRHESEFDRIVRAIVAARTGRAQVPDLAARCLIDQVRAIQHNAITRQRLTVASLEVREVNVLKLLAEGSGTGEIAARLNYSERTVKNIIHSVVTRFKVRNRTHAVAYALRAGVL